MTECITLNALPLLTSFSFPCNTDEAIFRRIIPQLLTSEFYTLLLKLQKQRLKLHRSLHVSTSHVRSSQLPNTIFSTISDVRWCHFLFQTASSRFPQCRTFAVAEQNSGSISYLTCLGRAAHSGILNPHCLCGFKPNLLLILWPAALHACLEAICLE